MAAYIGIDLGTSAVKLLLVDEQGKIHNEVTKEYPLEFPQPGWSQQNPEDWWNAVTEGIPELLAGFDAAQVAGIGCGGQMHGLVVLDKDDNVIRPAILWNDGRTAQQVDYMNGVIGKEKLSALTANIAFAGFTAPKILWMKENEPENFAKIAKIMLPKDYINYMLTGVHSCDYSDASGMLLLDVRNKCWSKEMLDICGISEKQMPKLFESYDCIGTIDPEIAKQLGIHGTVKVVAGAGDNAAAAVGTGTVGAGGCNISLGTSGTIFISSDNFGDGIGAVGHHNAVKAGPVLKNMPGNDLPLLGTDVGRVQAHNVLNRNIVVGPQLLQLPLHHIAAVGLQTLAAGHGGNGTAGGQQQNLLFMVHRAPLP